MQKTIITIRWKASFALERGDWNAKNKDPDGCKNASPKTTKKCGI
ncbi:MAG: hypothetical protein WCG03_04115 [Kiritimatiellales bacterium]